MSSVNFTKLPWLSQNTFLGWSWGKSFGLLLFFCSLQIQYLLCYMNVIWSGHYLTDIFPYSFHYGSLWHPIYETVQMFLLFLVMCWIAPAFLTRIDQTGYTVNEYFEFGLVLSNIFFDIHGFDKSFFIQMLSLLFSFECTCLVPFLGLCNCLNEWICNRVDCFTIQLYV